MTGATILLFPLFFLAGAGLGILYFALVHRTARLLAASRGGLRVAALYALRMVLAVTLFWQAAEAGALPLVAALVGFVAARAVVLRRTEAAE